MTLTKTRAKLKVKVLLIQVLLKFYSLGLCDVGTQLVTQDLPQCVTGAVINHTLPDLLKIDSHLYFLIGAESAENCTHINTDQVFLPLWVT